MNYRKKAILSFGAFVLFLLCTSVYAFTLGKDSKGNFLSWDINSMPIQYWIHIENASDKSAESKVRAVIRAFECWEIKLMSLASFKYAGLADANKTAFDGINVVTWIDSDWIYNPDTVAYTTLWVTESGRILDADIELNAEFFQWSAEGEADKMDIHNVLAHEIGHFVGIEHSIEATSLSMFPIIALGEVRKRIVKPDDLAAAAFLYPVVSTQFGIFELPEGDLLDELALAERLNTNYSKLNNDKGILSVVGIRLNSRGDAGIAALSFDSGSYLLGMQAKPGNPNENILSMAKGSWEVPDIFIKDIAALDIDGDDLDEVAVLGVDAFSKQAVYIYDSPEEGAFDTVKPEKWIARDLWRLPDASDSLMIFSLDLDGNGRRELATLSYGMEGIYIIKAYAPPIRFDDTNENALARGKPVRISFVVSGAILDIDSLDIDCDGVSELIMLVKGDFGYTVQVFRIVMPELPDKIQDFELLMVMSPVLEKDEYPVTLTVINGTDMRKPEILLTIVKARR